MFLILLNFLCQEISFSLLFLIYSILILSYLLFYKFYFTFFWHLFPTQKSFFKTTWCLFLLIMEFLISLGVLLFGDKDFYLNGIFITTFLFSLFSFFSLDFYILIRSTDFEITRLILLLYFLHLNLINFFFLGLELKLLFFNGFFLRFRF